ncbi:MAG: hypothetical protein AMXMBFR84_39000 [Candidatus Hydrogenedentota bacterium]
MCDSYNLSQFGATKRHSWKYAVIASFDTETGARDANPGDRVIHWPLLSKRNYRSPSK